MNHWRIEFNIRIGTLIETETIKTYQEWLASDLQAFVKWFAWFPLPICPRIVHWLYQAVRPPDDENNTRSSSIKRNKKNANSFGMRNSYSGWTQMFVWFFFAIEIQESENMLILLHVYLCLCVLAKSNLFAHIPYLNLKFHSMDNSIAFNLIIKVCLFIE